MLYVTVAMTTTPDTNIVLASEKNENDLPLGISLAVFTTTAKGC